MHHVTGPAGDDPAWLAIVLAVRVEEPAPVQPEVSEVPADGAHRDGDAVGGELVCDAGGGPLFVPPQGLDPRHVLGRGRGGLVVRDAGAVEQAEFTVFAVAGHPFAGAGSGDPHLGGDMGERAGLAPLDGRRPSTDSGALRWSTDGFFRSADELVVLPILPSEDPSAFVSPWWCLQRHDPQQLGSRRSADADSTLAQLRPVRPILAERPTHGPAVVQASYRQPHEEHGPPR